MAATPTYRYDVFVSHSQEDREWVEDWLLPRMEAAGLAACVGASCFEPGAPVAEETERAIRESRRTLVVLSPAWVDGQWDSFEALLVHAQDPAARGRRLIPLLLAPCDPPERIKLLQWVDFSEPGRQEAQLKRVIEAIQGTGALPELRPEDAFPSPKQRRWELRWFAVAGVAAVATLVVLVGFIVWQGQPNRVKAQTMLENEFNIAVAEFLSFDAEGKMLPKQQSPRFAQASANYLQRKLDSLTESLDQTVRVMGPEDLTGLDQVTDESAEETAAKVKAQILIYGSITSKSERVRELQLMVHFHDPSVQELAPELSGSYTFGAPIEFVVDGTGASKINAAVEDRLQALIPVIQGLQFFSHGMTEDFEKALDYFTQASESAWGQTSELVYLFLGHSYLRWDWMNNDNAHLKEAEKAFRKAIQLSPEYARAYRSLATVIFLKAYRYGGANRCGWDMGFLRQAYETQKRALELTEDQTGDLEDQLNAKLGIGRALFRTGICSEDLSMLLQAASYLGEVVEAYASKEPSTGEARLSEMLALSDLGYLEMHAACLASANPRPDMDSRTWLARSDDHLDRARHEAVDIDTEESRYSIENIDILKAGNDKLVENVDLPEFSAFCKKELTDVAEMVP